MRRLKWRKNISSVATQLLGTSSTWEILHVCTVLNALESGTTKQMGATGINRESCAQGRAILPCWDLKRRAREVTRFYTAKSARL